MEEEFNKITPFPEKGKIVKRLRIISTKKHLVFTKEEYYNGGRVITNEGFSYPHPKEIKEGELPTEPIKVMLKEKN